MRILTLKLSTGLLELISKTLGEGGHLLGWWVICHWSEFAWLMEYM